MNSPYPKMANSLSALRDRLRRRFSHSRVLRRSDALEPVADGGAGQEWIVARGLCAYTVLDGSGVPGPKRRAFADTAVRRWSPFPDPQFHVEWVGGRAMAWAWSRGRVLEGEGADGAAAPRRLSPESLYRGTPLAAGEVLVAMDRGVEGRVWRDHLLVASEWWPVEPGLADWNSFRRGAGLPADTQVPAVLDAPLADAPWSAAPRAGIGELASRYRTLGAAIGVGVLAAVMVTLLASAISLVVSIRLVEGEIADQGPELERILAAREQAGRDADAIDALLALRPPASQVDLFAAVLDATPGNDWQLLEWRMPDPRQLQVDLRMPRPDPGALVQSWESSARFEQVTVELGRQADEISIKAGIARPAP